MLHYCKLIKNILISKASIIKPKKIKQISFNTFNKNKMVKANDPRDSTKIVPYHEPKKTEDAFDLTLILTLGCLYATMMGVRPIIHLVSLVGISLYLTTEGGSQDSVKQIPLFMSLIVYLVMPYVQEYMKKQ